VRTKLLGVAGALAVLGFVSPASALIVDVTWYGTVTNSVSDPNVDYTGVFGTINTSGNAYEGDTYIANYVINTNIGDPTGCTRSTFCLEGRNTLNPVLSASVTVNGYTASVVPSALPPSPTVNAVGEIAANNGDYTIIYEAGTQDSARWIAYNQSFLSIQFNGAGNFPASPYQYILSDNNVHDSGALYRLVEYDDQYNLAQYTNIDATISFATISISDVQLTPLPTSWIMLLSGFVGLSFFAFCGAKRSTAALAAA
jgi:hypothetical protein